MWINGSLCASLLFHDFYLKTMREWRAETYNIRGYSIDGCTEPGRGE